MTSEPAIVAASGVDRCLFELSTADGQSISPYVWRTKFVLGRKGLPYRTELMGFSDIADIGPGTFRTLPVLKEGDDWLVDSWVIADHLDLTHPASPLFGSAAERATVRFVDRWLAAEIVTNLFRICALDILNRLHVRDHAYFRESREKRLRKSLEDAHLEREPHVPVLRQRLEPLRLVLRDQSFIGGEEPNYADYVAAGTLIWGGSVATIALLADEDALIPWLRRCLDLHGGVGSNLELPGLPGLR